MTITLYHYVHCPFCIRVRMALGFLEIPFISKVLAYDDEVTPVDLSGKKMLPILGTPSGVINESLDIIQDQDKKNSLNTANIVGDESFKDFEALLNRLSGPVHSLAMPYFIWTAEFSESSRKYFQMKKEEKRGPFFELVQNRSKFESAILPVLAEIEAELKPFYKAEKFSILDILLASHLWGLYVVPEFQFTPGIHSWLQKVKQITNFNYYEDYWK